MRSNSTTLRPQDVLVLARLIANQKEDWRQIDLARDLGISQAELSYSLKRLIYFGLVFSETRKIKKDATFEFIVGGVRYLFPATYRGRTIGIPTGISLHLLAEGLLKKDEAIIWPHPKGKLRGMALEPIYESIPEAALKDKSLHAVLGAIDMVRMSSGRVLDLAKKHLKVLIEKSP